MKQTNKPVAETDNERQRRILAAIVAEWERERIEKLAAKLGAGKSKGRRMR